MDDGHTRAGTITVMAACVEAASHWAWLPRLSREPGIRLTAEPVNDPTRLTQSLGQQQPDVLLLDKAMLDRLDANSLRRLHQQCDRVRVLLVWNEPCGDPVTEVLLHRFHGVLPASSRPDTCLKAIRAVRTGELWLPRASLSRVVAELLGLGHPDAAPGASVAFDGDAAGALSPRELQVVALLRRGYLNKQIAHELGIREDTVKKHLQSVFAKLGVHRRALVMLTSPGHPKGIWQGGRANMG